MASDRIEGTAAVFGDHVSADVVLPARHSFLPPEQMAEQVLMDLGPEANRKVRTHSVIVAGEAFGYGTGRESPSRALRAAGVGAVVARSFSRLFFRNAINNGIVVIQCPELAAMRVQDGDGIARAGSAPSSPTSSEAPASAHGVHAGRRARAAREA